jgi:mono/diheme cytochrome c family protein
MAERIGFNSNTSGPHGPLAHMRLGGLEEREAQMKNMMLAVAVVVCMFVLQMGCATTSQDLSSLSPQELQQVKEGKEIFNKNCDRCHPGGGAGVGPSLKASNLLSFSMRFKARHSSGAMPAFSQGMLTDEQLNSVVAYIKTLKD